MLVRLIVLCGPFILACKCLPLKPGLDAGVVSGAKPSPRRHGAEMRQPHLPTGYEPGTVPGEIEPPEPMPTNETAPTSSGQATSVTAGKHGQDYTASGHQSGTPTEAGTGTKSGVPQYPYIAAGVIGRGKTTQTVYAQPTTKTPYISSAQAAVTVKVPNYANNVTSYQPKSSGQATSVDAGKHGQEYTASGHQAGAPTEAGTGTKSYTAGGTQAQYNLTAYSSTNKVLAVAEVLGAGQTSQQGQNAKPTGTTIPPGINPPTEVGTGTRFGVPQYPYTARGRGGYLDANPQYPYTAGGYQAQYNATAHLSTNKFGAVAEVIPSNKHAGASQTSQQGQNAKPTGTTIPPGINPADYEPPEPLEPGEVPPVGAATRGVKTAGTTPGTAATASTGYTAVIQGPTNLQNGPSAVTYTRIDTTAAHSSNNNVGAIGKVIPSSKPAAVNQQGQNAKPIGTTIPPGVNPANYEPPEPLEPGELPPAGTANTGVTGKGKTTQTVYIQSTTQTPSSGQAAVTVNISNSAKTQSSVQNKVTSGSSGHGKGVYLDANTQTADGTQVQNNSSVESSAKAVLDISATAVGPQTDYGLSSGPVADVGALSTGTALQTQGTYRTSSASVMDTGAQTTTSTAGTSVQNKATSGGFGQSSNKSARLVQLLNNAIPIKLERGQGQQILIKNY